MEKFGLFEKIEEKQDFFLQHDNFPQFFHRVQIFPPNSDQNDLKTCPSRQN